MASFPQVTVCKHSAIPHLLTPIRDVTTSSVQFAYYASRLMALLAEEAMAMLPAQQVSITTPTGATLPDAVRINTSKVCAVSIIRAGDSLLEAVRKIAPDVHVGKILIQRDESSADKHPVMYYHKFPLGIARMPVILCDPMLATGGSVIMAVNTLLDAGCRAESIIFANVIAAPEGIEAVSSAHPAVRIVTCVIDASLNDNKYIMPGLGDFGDRFYGTEV
ncbi:uracil phosphoribosyltransferase-domain-containing protein [Tribonema minus]|uniref:uracil phosphoribosyltransferase n=1 Tax=Tribonema minus TaxID=303371 RepID=A0A836CLB7_9STRA|nr:uracil phosphoribosyltransferase-domain-containing protein [Tribonema minus]